MLKLEDIIKEEIKMKLKIIIMLSLLMIVLFGCGENNNNNQPNAGTFIGGTKGIEAKFEQMGTVETGIESVWVGESFPVEVTVRNAGEYEIPEQNLIVTILGIDTDLYNLPYTNNHNFYPIESKSELNPLGGEESISFGTAVLEQMTGLYVQANFNARIEYPYETYVAVPKTCFKYNLRDSSLCSPVGEKSASSSGAPIVATKVTQESGGSKRIALRFEIENKGGGRAIADENTFSENYDTINFELTEGGSNEIQFECTSLGNNNVARLTGGKGTIICKSTELPEDTLYEKQVTLKLSYTYRESIQKSLRIRNEPN
jgi:hypothetical protein